MAYELCTSGAIVRKAGLGVNSTLKTSGTAILAYYEDAEAYLNTLARYDFTSNFDDLTDKAKRILREAISNLGGVYMAAYDVSGYNSPREAESIINTNWARFEQCIRLLQEQEAVTFIK